MTDIPAETLPQPPGGPDSPDRAGDEILLAFAGPAPQRRLTVLVRIFMAIPHLIVLYALVERATPFERAATVMTMLSSAVIVGYAAGSSGAGLLADAGGHRAALAVPVAAGWCALLLALVARGRLGRLAPPAISSPSAS